MSRLAPEQLRALFAKGVLSSVKTGKGKYRIWYNKAAGKFTEAGTSKAFSLLAERLANKNKSAVMPPKGAVQNAAEMARNIRDKMAAALKKLRLSRAGELRGLDVASKSKAIRMAQSEQVERGTVGAAAMRVRELNRMRRQILSEAPPNPKRASERAIRIALGRVVARRKLSETLTFNGAQVRQVKTLSGKKFAVKSPYDPERIAIAKSYGGRFDPETKEWVFTKLKAAVRTARKR